MPQDTDHSPAAPQDSPSAHSPGKWARIAERLSEENLLRDGLGDQLRANVRDFRDNFHMKSPFDPE